jgi:light-regulated signal transduction histidine kinase (bacteriophytochrome)
LDLSAEGNRHWDDARIFRSKEDSISECSDLFAERSRYIVRHVVEAHGGTVHAESDGEGLGATFTVRLPVASASQ